MNILAFSWRDPKHPLAGGAEQVMHEHMKGWVSGGHKVVLFSSKVKGLEAKEELDGVEIIRSGYQYLGVQISGFLYYLKHKNQYDFVVDQFHGLPFFTPLYVRKPKLAVIQETARRVWFLNPFPRPLNWFVGLAGFLCEPFIFLFYKKTHFMTGSNSAKEDTIKMGIPSKNITVIPHGTLVDKSQIKNPKSQTKTIVYLGVLSKDKGVEDAISCFAFLNKIDKWSFWIIGKPETESYFNQLKGMVKNLGLSGKIKFWGFVSQKKKFELLSKAHILVNPSVHEGWGLVNIEANIVGTPVVAYSVSGIIDSVKDGVSGILCRQKTPEELAKIVDEILSNKKLYRKLAVGAKIWSKNFSWEKSRKLSQRLLNDLKL